MSKKHSQEIGAEFEDRLETMHQEYELQKRGVFWRNELTSRVVRTPGGPKVIRLQSQPDFSGVLPSGRFVYFDAKSISTVRQWTLPKDKQHQYEQLLRVSRMEALCFFLLECRPAGLCYVVMIHPHLERFFPLGRPQVKLRNDPEVLWVIPFQPADNRIDWLTAIQHHYYQTGFVPALKAGG